MQVPDRELATIIERRCGVAPSHAAALVAVQHELILRRSAQNFLAGKHGFITPRDLLRWAERGGVGYQDLAENGFLILGERLRDPQVIGSCVFADARSYCGQHLMALLGAGAGSCH